MLLDTNAISAWSKGDAGPSAGVPYHDLWIGALSLQHGLEVVSRDAHFDMMPGVRRLGW